MSGTSLTWLSSHCQDFFVIFHQLSTFNKVSEEDWVFVVKFSSMGLFFDSHDAYDRFLKKRHEVVSETLLTWLANNCQDFFVIFNTFNKVSEDD